MAGAQCATTAGVFGMRMLFVVSWGTVALTAHPTVHVMAKDGDPYCWMTWAATDQRRTSGNAPVVAGLPTTVITGRTPVLNVTTNARAE